MSNEPEFQGGSGVIMSGCIEGCGGISGGSDEIAPGSNDGGTEEVKPNGDGVSLGFIDTLL